MLTVVLQQNPRTWSWNESCFSYFQFRIQECGFCELSKIFCYLNFSSR